MALPKELQNKDWRMANLYNIIDRDGVLVTFAKNAAQQAFDTAKWARNIILKSRQLGFTTFESLDMLDDTLFTPNFDALMLSYDIPSQLDIFDNKILLPWENLDEGYKHLWRLDSERSNKLKFGFGTGEMSSVSVRTKGRSGTFRRVHISEFGKICRQDPRKAKEILAGTIQAVPLDGRVDIESTAEGTIGQFHDMFWEAWDRGEPERPVDYKAHFYNWTYDYSELRKITTPEKNLPTEFKDYQKEHKLTDIQITYYYYKWLSLSKDWDLLHQEYPFTPEEAFVSGGSVLFNVQKLKEMPTVDGNRVGNWIYYEDYIPGHRYGLGADPAEGYGGNSATIAILDFDYRDDKSKRIRPKLVAEYSNNKIQPSQFAYEVKNGGIMYGGCIAAVERNGPGLAVLGKLREIYHNVYTEIRGDKTSDVLTEKLGWITNVATKPKMVYDISNAINMDDIVIPSKPTVRELLSYEAEDVAKIKYDDEANSHWDRVISLCIAFQMASSAVPSYKKGTDLQAENWDKQDPLERFDII